MQVRTISYVYDIGGEDVFSLSVASMASKEGGVTLYKRALTIAVLSALSPFWRMVVAASCLFRPGRRQARRVKVPPESGRAKKGSTGTPAKKARKGAGPREAGDNPPGSSRLRGLPGPVPILGDAAELEMWQDAPGLDVEDRIIVREDLVGRCGWFWQHRPQPGARCLALLAYKTLGDLRLLRVGRDMSSITPGTFGRLVNVPGDNDCFYHVIASGLMDRLMAFPDLPKSPFWEDVGAHPGLLRWGVAAYQRAMVGNGPLSYLFPCWLSLTCPGQSFAHPAEGQAVLQKAILECEGERSWMGSYHGEYAVLADVLGAIIRVLSPIGCQPDGAMLAAHISHHPASFSVADAFIDVVGEDSHRRCVLRAGSAVVQLKPSCVHVPLHCVAQAVREVMEGGGSSDSAAAVHTRARQIALARPYIVLGVIHDGSAHFIYPHVHPSLFQDYTGATLPAFHLDSATRE